MAESMGEITKFMAEIIRLLTDLVAAVKQNEDLIRETQGTLHQIAQSAGMTNLATAGKALENAIAMLQKGVQAFQIQNALRQVQEFIGAMGSAAPVGGQVQVQNAPQTGQPQGSAPQQEKGKSDEGLIKPSDLFG